MSLRLGPVVPILRIFDAAKAREFYVDYLGFTVAWEHRYEPSLPLYMEVGRGGVKLHLSEHHGDGSPGVNLRIEATGLAEYQAELAAKDYGYLRPGVGRNDHGEHGEIEMCLTDPFGNRLTLVEILTG